MNICRNMNETNKKKKWLKKTIHIQYYIYNFDVVSGYKDFKHKTLPTVMLRTWDYQRLVSYHGCLLPNDGKLSFPYAWYHLDYCSGDNT